jgi:hypothetical protein
MLSDIPTDDLEAHTSNTSNPHGVTAEQIGAATTTQVSEAKALASSAGATAGQAMTTATNAQRAAGLAQAAADSKAPLDHTHTKSQITDFPTTETWTFTLEDGSTVTKAVYVG